MATWIPSGFSPSFADVITRVIGDSGVNLVKLLTRISIPNETDLAGLPLEQNKDDLRGVLRTLNFEANLSFPFDYEHILLQYDAVWKVCRYNAVKVEPSEAPVTPTVTVAGPPGRPRYIRRSVFLAMRGGAQVDGVREEAPVVAPKRAKPTISRSDERADPFSVATEFAERSNTFKLCKDANYGIENIESFVMLSLGNRCKTTKTLRGASCLVAEYILFARMHDPPLIFGGPSALITVQKWLCSLATRGFTVPAKGRYALKVYSEALGVDLPLRHPGVLAAIRKPRTRRLRQAPPITVEFVILLERVAVSRDTPFGLRYYAAMFVLMTLASLRFCDTRDVADFWTNDTAVCGVSIDHKSKSAELMVWASPKGGFESNSLWLAPIAKVWKKVQPERGAFVNLSPLLGPDLELISRRVGTHGTVQAVLTMLGEKVGLKSNLKLHSPRTFFATCAGQLRFSREEREKLGRWAPGSVMPERYDRAVCVTELRIRDDIVSRIVRDGWRPEASFAVPAKGLPKPLSQASDLPTQASPPETFVETDSASSTSSEEVDISKLED